MALLGRKAEGVGETVLVADAVGDDVKVEVVEAVSEPEGVVVGLRVGVGVKEPVEEMEGDAEAEYTGSRRERR